MPNWQSLQNHYFSEYWNALVKYLASILKLNKIKSLLCVSLNRNYREIRTDNAANWFAFAYMPKQAQTHRYLAAWQRPTINDDFQMTYCQLRHDFHNTSTYKYVVVIVDKYTENTKKKNNYNQRVWENFFNNRN